MDPEHSRREHRAILAAEVVVDDRPAEEAEEAARTLGASPYRVVIDVIMPGLMPSLIAAGAIAFATAMNWSGLSSGRRYISKYEAFGGYMSVPYDETS